MRASHARGRLTYGILANDSLATLWRPARANCARFGHIISLVLSSGLHGGVWVRGIGTEPGSSSVDGTYLVLVVTHASMQQPAGAACAYASNSGFTHSLSCRPVYPSSSLRTGCSAFGSPPTQQTTVDRRYVCRACGSGRRHHGAAACKRLCLHIWLELDVFA